MSADAPSTNQGSVSITGELLDLSVLVGHEVSLYSDQFPGKPLRGRVLSCQDKQMVLDGGSRADALGNLVANQTVVLQFTYKGEAISLKAQLRKGTGGRCYFVLEDRVTPLSQRKFRRIDLHRLVRLAPFPKATFFAARTLAQLRWIETEMINFSSGGVLLSLPSFLERDVYLLVHIVLKGNVFPNLILAQVRHCFADEEGKFKGGLEFLVKEQCEKLLPPSTRKALPLAVFSYSAINREKLNKMLQGWTPAASEEII